MLERNGLSIITEQKSTITMSSREIADLPMKSNWNGEFTQDKAVGL